MFENATLVKVLAKIMVFVLILFSPVASMAESSCNSIGNGPFGPVWGGFAMGVLALAATLVAGAVIAPLFPPAFIPTLQLIASGLAIVVGFYTGYRVYKKLGGSLSRIKDHNDEKAARNRACEVSNQKIKYQERTSEEVEVFSPAAVKQDQPEMQMQNNQNRQKLLQQYYDAAAKGDSALMQKLSIELKTQP